VFFRSNMKGQVTMKAVVQSNNNSRVTILTKIKRYGSMIIQVCRLVIHRGCGNFAEFRDVSRQITSRYKWTYFYEF